MNRNQLLELFPLGNPDGLDAQRHERMDPVTAITAGAGIVTNIVGGFAKGNAATQASKIQADAATAAARKIEGDTRDQRGAILESARNAGGSVVSAAEAASRGVTSAADRSNALIDPYRVAGEESMEEIRRNLVPGGDFNKTPTIQDITIDPGYAWRVQEAQRALERGAAARGTVQSGGFLKDLNREIQGSASQEYQNAFERYRQNTTDRFSRLSGVSSQGKDAASEQGNNIRNAALFTGNSSIDASKFSGQADIDANRLVAQNAIDASRTAAGYDTDAAQAIATGKIAKVNAITGGFTGATNAATSGLLVNKYLTNPTSAYSPSSYIPMPLSPSGGGVLPPFVPAYPSRF